jgi:F-type H+-transporting ATPase subunit alpha
MLQFKETGQVLEIRQTIAKISGLSTCLYGQKVNFLNGAVGMVMGFNSDEVSVLLLMGMQTIRAGDSAYSLFEIFDVPVGEAFLGRIVNPLCEPLDKKGPISPSDRRPVFGEAVPVLERKPVEHPIETGIKILDTMIPIGKGQRELIIGDRMTGKTTLVTDIILNQKGKDVICIYCCIGKSESALNKVIQLLQSSGAIDYSIVVSATASSPPGQQYLAPYVACSLGEYFMNQGQHVLVGFDDFTRHAWTYRQLSLLMERSPGRDAYPGDVFYLHSRMIELAANLGDERGGGSMTFLPIVETLQGDVTGYIPSNLISMTDGQIYVNTELFREGVKPAIDLGLSVSRIGSKVQWPAIKALSGMLRLEYIQYKELERLTKFKSGASEEVEAKLRKGRILKELLKQDRNHPVPMEEQVVILYLYREGKLDAFSNEQLRHFQKSILNFVQKEKPELLKEIADKKTLTPEIKEALDALLGQGSVRGQASVIRY